MNRRIVAGLTALSALLYAGAAQAGTLVYGTGFEPPAFAVGSQLLGQDGWSTAIPPFLNPSAAQITDSLAASGLQAVRVRGADMASSPLDPDSGLPLTDPFDAVGSYRHPVSFDTAAAGLPVVRLRTDLRVDGPGAGPAKFFSASLAARSGDAGYAELEIASNGLIYAYTSQDGTLATSAPVTLNAWHTLGIDVDYAKDQFTFLLDDVSLGVFPFDPAYTSDVLGRGALVTYALPDASSANFARADYSATFDNFSITAVPEPSSQLLALVAGAMALLTAQRSRYASRDRRDSPVQQAG